MDEHDQDPSAAQAGIQHAASFGHIVTVLMRSAKHRLAFLTELEWLAAPPAASGQFALSMRRNPKTGAQTPIGVVMWASVSKAVDERLSKSIGRPQLRPEEWVSGNIPWLIEAVGEPRATAMLLKELVETRFAATGLKALDVDAKGRVVVKTLKPEGAAKPGAAKAAAATAKVSAAAAKAN